MSANILLNNLFRRPQTPRKMLASVWQRFFKVLIGVHVRLRKTHGGKALTNFTMDVDQQPTYSMEKHSK